MKYKKQIKANLLDKVVSFFDPVSGAKRVAARARQQMLIESVRGYDAAKRRKVGDGFHASGSSANTEISRAGHKLRDVARELARNNGYAKSAIERITANTTGSGIRASIRNKNKGIENEVKALWDSWATSKNIDISKKQNLYGIQFLAMRTIVESGEVLILKRRARKASPVPFYLQVLEGDYIDTSKDGLVLDNGNYIQLGIEKTENEEIVAYWLFPQHPGENKIWKDIQSKRVPASEVIHAFFMERPGQLRGVPFGAASFNKLRDFEDYEHAQLIRQKIAACFSVFINTPENAPVGSVRRDGGPPLERVEPGIIEYLQPGESVEFGNPPATEGYDMYAKKTLQNISAGYGITYEGLTNDLSNVNFSSGRMGWIEFGRMVTQWQNQILISQICEDVFAWFLDGLKMTGKRVDGTTATWTPPRREMIDPLKETKGVNEAIRAGLNSWSGAVREAGRDPEAVYNELVADKEKMDKAGLKLTVDPDNDTNRVETTPETGGKTKKEVK